MKLFKFIKLCIIILLSLIFFKVNIISEADSVSLWSKTVPSVEVLNPRDSAYQYKLSNLYPTGLYANKNDTITIKGKNINVCLGPPGKFQYKNDNEVKKYPINGETQIQMTAEVAIIYVENTSGNEQSISIQGAKKFPLFEKGQSIATEFLSNISDSTPFIELVGEHSILTIPNPYDYKERFSKIEKNYGLNNFVDYFDKVAIYGLEASGLSFRSPNSLSYVSGKIHYVKADEALNNGIFNATDFRISLHNTAKFVDILDEFTESDSRPPMMNAIWGVWHETGHLFQNPYIMWEGMSEVTVNISSYYTMSRMGHSVTELTDFLNLAPKIRDYLESQNKKNYDENTDAFFKLGMFAQLMVAYGDDVFAKLNNKYRNAMTLNEISSPEKYSKDEKQQMFMVYLCEITKRDLSEFFKKWGLIPNNISIENMGKYKRPSVPIEKNVFYDNEKVNHDGDNSKFENLYVDVRSINSSMIESGIDSLKAEDLFDVNSLCSIPDKSKLSLNSFHVLYKNSNFLVVNIVSNEGPSGNYKVPLIFDNSIGKKYWGSVQWDFDTASGTLNLLTSGILGEAEDSPWKRGDENRIESRLIKKIVLKKNIYAPQNSNYLFNHLENIEEFEDLTFLDTSYAISMVDMFAYNPKLKCLDLSSFKTSNVYNFQGLFYGSRSIEILNLSNFDTTNVISFPYMFSSLNQLRELTLGEKSIFIDQSIGSDISHEWVNIDAPNVIIGKNNDFFENLRNFSGKKAGKYIWKSEIKNYKKVKFITNEGTEVDDQYILSGKTLSPVFLSRSGYTFEKWYKDEIFSIPFSFETPITEDITIYAKWKKLSIVIGDINKDGEVDLDDLTGLIAYLNAGILPQAVDEEYISEVGDVNKDGKVDLDDLTTLVDILNNN